MMVVELPDNDPLAGGVQRTLKMIMELPFYDATSGGIIESLKLSAYNNISVRFQNLSFGYPNIPVKWTVGLPDNTFPECDVCITYSGNPYLKQLTMLPQVGKVFLLMLSYGMNLKTERNNILNKDVTVLCSTKKLEAAIRKEGVNVHRIGVALDMGDMYLTDTKRHRYVAILYHSMITKRYATAVALADRMCEDGIIDGVITFGRKHEYNNFRHPKYLVRHYENATREQVREIFNQCMCYLMPSSTEGLNLTPIEATLCGCPSVICDGAIGEIFFDGQNCFIAPMRDESMMVELVRKAIDGFDKYSSSFREHMLTTIKDMKWGVVTNNLTKIICGQ